MSGFRITRVVNGTNWRAVPLSDFDLEHRPRGTPLLSIVGDSGPTLTVQYHNGIVEYDQLPTAESLGEYYRSAWMGETVEQVAAKARQVAAQQPSGHRLKLLEGLSGLDTAVDVGAGYGDQVRSLQAIAKTVRVIEPCEARAAALREVYGCETLHGSFPDVRCDADLIVCHHVIEHVRSAEYVFAAFSECQKPGGRLVITCPRFDWEPSIGVALFWPHQRSFTEPGLRLLAKLFGYVVEAGCCTESDLAFRFVKRAGEVEITECCPPDYYAVNKLRRGLGLMPQRNLLWEYGADGCTRVGESQLAYWQRQGVTGRCLEIDDLRERKTDAPIEIQWANGPTRVFVK